MLRDIVRAGLVMATMSVGAGILIETRLQLAMIDVAHRNVALQAASAIQPQAAEPSPIRRLGRASISLADAALGIIR